VETEERIITALNDGMLFDVLEVGQLSQDKTLPSFFLFGSCSSNKTDLQSYSF